MSIAIDYFIEVTVGFGIVRDEDSFAFVEIRKVHPLVALLPDAHRPLREDEERLLNLPDDAMR